jgi:hypothetical protein
MRYVLAASLALCLASEADAGITVNGVDKLVDRDFSG